MSAPRTLLLDVMAMVNFSTGVVSVCVVIMRRADVVRIAPKDYPCKRVADLSEEVALPVQAVVPSFQWLDVLGPVVAKECAISEGAFSRICPLRRSTSATSRLIRGDYPSVRRLSEVRT